MKKLNLLDQSTNFKVNDTGTIIPFNAFENNQPFGVTENETSVFRIKNKMGFLKAVNATVAAGGYIFQLNTKDLVGLVPGTYEIELTVKDNQSDEELIFPDNGFCSFNITTSALTITGTQIPTMSLDSFKQQLEQYVQVQTDTKIQGIEDDFTKYVETVKQGPQGDVGPAGADGKAATISIGKTVTTDAGQSASVTNSGTPSDVVLNFTIPRGEQGPVDTQAISVANEAKMTADNASDNVEKSIDDFNTQISTLKGTLSLVPNNLIPDAGFNQALSDNYTLAQGSNATIDVITNGYNGDNSLKVSVTSQTGLKYYGAQIRPAKFLLVNAGDHYSFSAMVKAYDLDASAKVEINFFDSGKSRVDKTGILIDNPIGNDWTLAKLEDFVIPSGAVYMNVNFFVYKNGTIEVAHPQLVYGSVAPSSWLPSVSDLSEQISNLQSQINALKG